MTPPRMLTDALAAATGRERRDDPALPRTGGPAGNAQLTAWIGLILLVLFLAELVTLLDVTKLISWHIVIGVLLVPPALVKTATTGWRILRYYTGTRAYRQAGPPPLLLRLLGPLVVLSTLALLGSGLALIAVGPDAAPMVTLVGQPITALTIHQASTFVWAAATGLHVLARTLPAFGLAVVSGHGGGRLAGLAPRTFALLATLAVAAFGAVIVLALASSWTVGDLHRPPPGEHQPGRAGDSPPG